MYQRAKYKDNLTLENMPDPVGSKKYDGGMFFAIVGKNGSLRFISRRQSVKGHYPDRTAQLPQFHDIRLPDHVGSVLGLELIHTGHSKESPESHPAVSGILNSLPARAMETQRNTGPIRAVLHDVIKPKLNTYKEKLNYLKGIEDKVGKPNLLFVPDFAVGVDAIKKLVQKTKKEGHEGVIVTSLSQHESQNPRLKIKHRHTWNLRIKDIHQEFNIYGKPKPSMGALVLEDAAGREVGEVGTGFTHAFRREVWNHKKKYLKTGVQVKGMPPVREGMKLKMLVYNGFSDGEIDTIP